MVEVHIVYIPFLITYYIISFSCLCTVPHGHLCSSFHRHTHIILLNNFLVAVDGAMNGTIVAADGAADGADDGADDGTDDGADDGAR